MRAAIIFGCLAVTATAHADDAAPLLHAELDPFPFATLAYGGQLGVRHPALGGVRVAVASFALNVPDAITQLGDNAGWHLRVRPSAALYVLYYTAAPGEDGFAFGGALRYLRTRYRHDDTPGEDAFVEELSPEAIVAYQWHPFANGFYLQPWLGLSFTLARAGEARVGARAYDDLPVLPFVTVNLGWELAL